MFGVVKGAVEYPHKTTIKSPHNKIFYMDFLTNLFSDKMQVFF